MIEAHIGLLDLASSEFRTALAIDPTNTLARHRVGVALIYQLRHAEALAVFRETPRDFNPSLWTYHVGWTLLYLGRKDESAATIAEFRRLETKDRGGVVASVEAIAAAVSGDAASAERAIASAVESGKGFGHFHHARTTSAPRMPCSDAPPRRLAGSALQPRTDSRGIRFLRRIRISTGSEATATSRHFSGSSGPSGRSGAVSPPDRHFTLVRPTARRLLGSAASLPPVTSR